VLQTKRIQYLNGLVNDILALNAQRTIYKVLSYFEAWWHQIIILNMRGLQKDVARSFLVYKTERLDLIFWIKERGAQMLFVFPHGNTNARALALRMNNGLEIKIQINKQI